MVRLVEKYLPVVSEARGYYSNFPIYAPIKDKGSQVYNVLGYGVKGDGTTDDTTAMQAVINTAYTAGGGTVFLPKGTYIINPSTGLQVKSNVILAGVGAGSIIKIANSANVTGNLVKVESWTNVVIQDVLLEGNSSHQGAGTNYGLYFGTSTNCRAFRVITQNFTGNGVHVYNNTGTVVEACLSKGNTFHGYEVEQCIGCTLVANRGTGNALHGCLISPGEVAGTGSVGNSIIGNTFDTNSQYGIGANAANGDISAWLNKGNIIKGNSIYSNTQYGIQMYKQNNNIITDNFIYNNGFFGLYLYQSQNNVVQGNIIMQNSQIGAGSYDEIMIEGYNDNNAHPSKNNIVTENQILITGTTKARYGVNQATTNDGPNIVVGNSIPTSGGTGIYNNIQAQVILTPASAPTLANNSTVALYLDESGNNLKVAVKYSNGTTKTGTLAVS